MGLVKGDNYHTLEVTLTGPNNKTLTGFLNFTSLVNSEEEYNSQGAATFIVAVIMVYGLSIVLLIGSLAKKNLKHKQEDHDEKQTSLYLTQAPDLREKGARENYKNLKKKVITLVSQSTTPDLSPRPSAVQIEMGYHTLNGLLAVASPVAAPLTASSTDSTRNPFFSDCDSTKPLLESTDRLSDEVFDPAKSPSQSEARQTRYGHVPRVVITESPSGRSPSDSASIEQQTPETSSSRRGSEDSRRNIYDKRQEQADRNQVESGCHLSMDAQGNIWILQTSPEISRKQLLSSGPDSRDNPLLPEDPVIPYEVPPGDVFDPQTGHRRPCPGVCHPGHHQSIGQVTRIRRSPSPVAWDQSPTGPRPPPIPSRQNPVTNSGYNRSRSPSPFSDSEAVQITTV